MSSNDGFSVVAPTSVMVPASALRRLPGARFYITLGAAKRLRERQVCLLAQHATISDEQVEQVIVDLALKHGKRVLDVTDSEAQADAPTQTVLGKRGQPLAELAQLTHRRLVEKSEAGSSSLDNVRFLHTEPHHDDLMLS